MGRNGRNVPLMRLLPPLLLLLLTLPLVRLAPTEDGQEGAGKKGFFSWAWERVTKWGSQFGRDPPSIPAPTVSPTVKPAAGKGTPAPATSPAEEPMAVNTTTPLAVGPTDEQGTKQIAPAPTTPMPPEDSGSEDSEERGEEAGKATGGPSGREAEVVPWWVGLLAGLALAGWMVACTVAIMYRRGCAFRFDRQPEPLEMSKFPSPLTVHRYCDPPPYYQNPSYSPSPPAHIYEEPQFPPCDLASATGAPRGNESSKKPSISKRPPAVPFRPEEFANDPDLVGFGAVDTETSDASLIHRNSLYNRVPDPPAEATGLCPVCSVHTSSGRCERGEGDELRWKFPRAEPPSPAAAPSAGAPRRSPLHSGDATCSHGFHQYDALATRTQRSALPCVYEDVDVDAPVASASAAAAVAVPTIIVDWDGGGHGPSMTPPIITPSISTSPSTASNAISDDSVSVHPTSLIE